MQVSFWGHQWNQAMTMIIFVSRQTSLWHQMVNSLSQMGKSNVQLTINKVDAFLLNYTTGN